MKPPPSPEFWARSGLASDLLQPFAWGYAAAGAAQRALTTPWQASVPVLCVGNIVAGGAGKTPVALSLAQRLIARGRQPHFLTRGYGGRLAGPVAVDPATHDAQAVGDEPLLLVRVAPTWVARDRVAGARAASAAGAKLIVMDDGFQNPSLAKTLSLLVIDGGYGLGNGRLIPAGPLREKLSSALARADAIVLVGEDETQLLPSLAGRTVLRARLAPAGAPTQGPYIAFAGIGRPDKFFRTLEEAGAQLVGRAAFADHHLYRDAELRGLEDTAKAAGARLITTAKDAVRLPPAWRHRIAVLEVEISWQDATLDRLLERLGG
jgi:tetraacyldisaccharide 4'-kinase